MNKNNLASVLLPNISGGEADREFSDVIGEAIKAVEQTAKKAKVCIEIEIVPIKDDRGGTLMSAVVTSKMPKLDPPATMMNVADDGSVLTQLDFLMFGGRDERKNVKAADNYQSSVNVAQPAAAETIAKAEIAEPFRPIPIENDDDDELES